MKKNLLAMLLLVSAAAAGTNDPSPSFEANKLQAPSTRNAVTKNQKQIKPLADGKTLSRQTNSIFAPHWKLVSKMPVINPKAECDAAMIKTPDSSNDYKLLVKRPDIELIK